MIKHIENLKARRTLLTNELAKVNNEIGRIRDECAHDWEELEVEAGLEKHIKSEKRCKKCDGIEWTWLAEPRDDV